MAEFHRAFRIQGFDRFARPDWQMVPAGGVRYVILRNGAGFTLTSRNTARCTVVEVNASDLPGDDRQPFEAGDRFFKLTGVSKGSCLIDAKSGATTVSLEAGVKNQKTVKIKLNFVSDNAAPAHKTVRVAADVEKELRVATWIYREQLNVKLHSLGSRDVVVSQNLGDVVRFSSHLPAVPASEHEWDLVTAKRDSGADLNFFFVWEYEQDDTPNVDHTNAGTLGGNCIFEDDIGAGIPVWRTMAHEIGHHLGVPDHYDDTKKYELMYGRSDRGIHIPKAHADIMNP